MNQKSKKHIHQQRKGVVLVKEKKKYEYPELEIIKLQASDVIATSWLSNDDDAVSDPNGWT